MKIKKRLKHKSCLPKADNGMDPKALSNMNKQAAEETSAQGGGMGAAMGMNIASQGLNFISSLTPQDNEDGIGMSHKASRITGAVSGGLDAAASATSSIPIVGSAIGGVSALFKMIKGAVDHKRENDKSITSRLARKEYDPTNNNTGYSFGVPQAPTSQPLFGGQAKYGMPLYGNGGTPIYVTDQNDPRLKSYQDSLAFYNSGEYLNSKLNTGASGMVTKSQYYDALKGAQSKYLKSNNLSWQGANSSLYLKPIRQNPVDFWEKDTQIRKTDYDIYKKPLQPVIYKKPEVSVPKPKFNVTIPQEEKQSMQELLGKVQYASEPTSQHEKPVESGTFNNMFTQEVKTMNGKKIYKRKDTKSPWIEQYKNGGEPSFAFVDNTKTKLTPPQKLTVKQLSNIKSQQQIQKQLDQNILSDRKARIETSNKYNKTPLAKTTKETISNSLEGTPDKMRLFPNDPHSFIDDYLNPGVMIGSMAKNLAQSKSAKDYALSIGTPLTVGALAGLGTKNTRQFINNITNPLAGIKNPFEDIIRPKNPALTAGQQEWLSQHETIKKVLDKNPNANVKKGLEDLKNNTSNFPNKESIDLRKSDDYIKKRKEIIGSIGYENSKLQNDKIFDFKLNEQLKNSTTASKEFIQDNIKSADNDWLRSTNEMSLMKQAFRDSYDLQKESKLLNKPFKGPLADWYKEASDIANTNHNIDALYNNKTIQFKESIDNYYNHYDPKIPSEKLLDKDFYMRKNKFGGPVFALGGDPRSQSNIEAEQGEAMQHSSGKIEAIGGKKHPQGGTPLKVQPSHEYIYSDSLGRDKNGNITLNEKDVVKSFADDAKSIQRRYSKREGDSIVDKTKELELAFLKQDAEQARVAKEEIEMGKQIKKYKAKYGADLKKFGNSGYTQYGVIPSGKQPSQEDDILTIQKRMLQADPNALPKYGADGSWGTESQTAFDKLSPQIGGAPQFTFNTNSSTIPLFGGGVNPNPFIGPKPFNPSRRDNLHEAANFYTPGQVGTPRMATPSIDQRSTAPEVADKVKNGMFSSLTTGDKMQLASMLPAFGFNMGMGLRKADVEPNRKNLYEKDVVNIMQNRKFDIQNYLNQSNLATNTAKEDIGNNSTSVGGKMANLQKLYANQLGTLGDITTKGQEMNNQYRAEEANTKNILGEANRAESIRAAGINDQNKARKQQFLAKAFEQMGQGLATTGQSANQSLTNKLLIKSLSEISPDFDVKNMKDIEVDNEGYIVFKGQKTEFKMSDEGKIVMAGGTPNTANAIKSQYAPKDFIMKTFANFTKAKTK